MSFKFNFGANEKEEIEEKEDDIPQSSSVAFKEHDIRESTIRKYKEMIERNKNHVKLVFGNIRIIQIQNSDDLPMEFKQLDRDVIEKKYEGGFRIWECVKDLVNHLKDLISNKELENKRILEIGCGLGIPGLFSLVNGNISLIDFQDYNLDVIEKSTIPNILLNISDIDFFKKCRFFSGDWKDFPHFKKYDLIIASEILYKVENYENLETLFRENLSKEKGSKVIISTKKNYFGLDGSSFSFMRFLEKRGDFKIRVEKEIIDGNSTIRQILVLEWM